MGPYHDAIAYNFGVMYFFRSDHSHAATFKVYKVGSRAFKSPLY